MRLVCADDESDGDSECTEWDSEASTDEDSGVDSGALGWDEDEDM